MALLEVNQFFEQCTSLGDEKSRSTFGLAQFFILYGLM